MPCQDLPFRGCFHSCAINLSLALNQFRPRKPIPENQNIAVFSVITTLLTDGLVGNFDHSHAIGSDALGIENAGFCEWKSAGRY